MTKFSDLNIIPKSNKITFNVPAVSIHTVLNCEIEVLDFEANVKTKHGDGRYIIMFRQFGVDRKFFTASDSLKNDLDQVKKTDFPFTTTIVMECYPNGKSFKFT